MCMRYECHARHGTLSAKKYQCGTLRRGPSLWCPPGLFFPQKQPCSTTKISLPQEVGWVWFIKTRKNPSPGKNLVAPVNISGCDRVCLVRCTWGGFDFQNNNCSLRGNLGPPGGGEGSRTTTSTSTAGGARSSFVDMRLRVGGKLFVVRCVHFTTIRERVTEADTNASTGTKVIRSK